MTAQAVARRFNDDRSDHAGPRLACPCGQSERYAGRRPNTFQTKLGGLTLERAYYDCAACKQSFFPRDKALGTAGASLSPAVTRMTGSAAGPVSFAEASALLEEFAGVRVATKRVERTAEALGGAIAAAKRAVVEPKPPVAPTIYLGRDGTGVPVRNSELAGRAGQQPDGTAKTRGVKLVTVWTAEMIGKPGRSERDKGSVSCTAAIGNLTAEMLPGAIQIVDLWHSLEHLWTVSKALHGEGSAQAGQWANGPRRAARS